MFIPIIHDVASWGWWYAYFNPTKKDVVNKTIQEEINKVVKDGFTEEEFKSSLNSWIVSRKTDLGADGTLMRLVIYQLLYGYSLDEYDNLETKIKVNQINDVVRKFISKDKMTSVFAGDMGEVFL